MDIERAYRRIIYRRPVGVFYILMLIIACNAALGMSLHAATVHYPFFPLHLLVFSLLLIAIAGGWLLQAIVSLKKKDLGTGVFMACLSTAVACLGASAFAGGWSLFAAP